MPSTKRTLIFLLELSYELKTYLAEEYLYKKDLDDGKFYCKIRGHQRDGNEYFEARWWARLDAISDVKKGRLERLFRDEKMTAAFNFVLEFPALAGGIMIGNLHKLLGIGCDKVRSMALIVHANYP